MKESANKEIVKINTDIMKVDESEIMEILKDTFNEVAFEEKTAAEIEKIKRYILKMSCGSSSFMSLICRGESCIYRSSCELLKKDSTLKAPLGKACPFERYWQKKWFNDYKEAVQIDINDRVEVSQVNDLVEIEIMKARVNAILAEEGIKIDVVVGVDPDSGMPLTTQQQHYAINIKDINDRRKDKILKSLLATREAKTSAMGKKIGDISDLIQKAMTVYKQHNSPVVQAEVIKDESNQALKRGGFEESETDEEYPI